MKTYSKAEAENEIAIWSRKQNLIATEQCAWTVARNWNCKTLKFFSYVHSLPSTKTLVLLYRSSAPKLTNWKQDDLTDIEKEDIDRAIALSLSEEDHKGKKVVGKIYAFVVPW